MFMTSQGNLNKKKRESKSSKRNRSLGMYISVNYFQIVKTSFHSKEDLNMTDVSKNRQIFNTVSPSIVSGLVIYVRI